MTAEVRRIASDDEEIVEAWTRVTDEEHILGVGAVKSSDDTWAWQVTISVAEYVRDEPLQSRLHEAITVALKAVPSVADAAQEDREVWVVDGTPSGDALVQAASNVLDAFADETRKAYGAL